MLSCDRKKQISLHIGSVSFTLTFVHYCFCYKNVAYSRKYTGEPILKALTFKSITIFHSYRDKKLQNREQYLPWRFTWTWWPDLHAQLQEQRIPAPRSLQQTTMTLPHLAFKNTLLKPFRQFRVSGHEPPVSLLGPAINLSLLLTPTLLFVWLHRALGAQTCIC